MQITHVKSNTIGDATGTVTFWNGTTTGSAAATNLVRPSDWNSQHALQFTLSGNTTQNSTVSGTNVTFAASNAMSIGGSNGSVVFHGKKLNQWRPFELGNNSSYSAIPNGTASFQYFVGEEYVEFSQIEFWGRGTYASSTNNNTATLELDYGLYSNDTGTNSTRMTLIGSSQVKMTHAYSSSTSIGFTFSHGTTSFVTGSGGSGLLTQILSGPNHYYFPYSGTLYPNRNYALGLVVRHGGATQAGSWQPLVLTMMNSRSMGRVALSGVQNYTGVTVIGDRECGTRGTASLPATLAKSDLGIAVSRAVLYVQFED